MCTIKYFQHYLGNLGRTLDIHFIEKIAWVNTVYGQGHPESRIYWVYDDNDVDCSKIMIQVLKNKPLETIMSVLVFMKV